MAVLVELLAFRLSEAADKAPKHVHIALLLDGGPGTVEHLTELLVSG